MSKHTTLMTIIKTKRSTECEDCGQILPQGKYMFYVHKDYYCHNCAPRYCNPPESMGDRIVSLRVANGLQQKELAEMCEFGGEMLRRYEYDIHMPGSERLMALAVQLNTTTDYLLGLSEDPNWR